MQKGDTSATRRVARGGGSSTVRHKDKVTYILGAGFSHPTGMPVLSQFIPEAFQLLKEEEKDYRKDVLLARVVEIIRYYQNVAAAVGINPGNLEDIFCLAELDIADEGRPHHGDTLKEFIIRVVNAAWKRHEKACNDLEHPGKFCLPVARRHLFPVGSKSKPLDEAFSVCAYEAFLSRLLATQANRRTAMDLDAIITLNYDLILEQKLANSFPGTHVFYGRKVLDKKVIGNRHHFYIPEVKKWHLPVTIPIFKLHGSVNWMCAGKGFKFITQLHSSEQVWRSPLSQKLLRQIPIVAPTWRKAAENESVFSKIASQALEHLQRAGKIVIIGYSMPPSDRYFRYLLAKALSTAEFPIIEIWDVVRPSIKIPELRGLLGSEHRERIYYSDKGLLGYVQSHCSPSAIPHTPVDVGLKSLAEADDLATKANR